MRKVFGLLTLMVFAPGNLCAQDAPHLPPSGEHVPGGGQMRMQFQMPSFADLDKNKDKKLSRDEMPSQFPPQVFDRLDSNHSGFVEEEEWTAMRGRFMGGSRVGESLTKLLDSDHDGKVSREEFAKLLAVFDTLDSDHNGDLSQEELNGFFRGVSEAQTQATGGVEVGSLFEKYDKDKDGKISGEEMGNERTFKALDLSKDGFVTREEADTALKQLQKARESKKAQAPPSN